MGLWGRFEGERPLEHQEGATIADLMAATGCLPHTTRAALSGSRKKGVSLVRERSHGQKGSVYRIEPQSVSWRPDPMSMATATANMTIEATLHRSVTDRLAEVLAELGLLDANGLHRRWRNLVGAPMPQDMGRRLTLRVLSYKLQAQQLGDLDKASLRELTAIFTRWVEGNLREPQQGRLRDHRHALEWISFLRPAKWRKGESHPAQKAEGQSADGIVDNSRHFVCGTAASENSIESRGECSAKFGNATLAARDKWLRGGFGSIETGE